MNKQIDITSLIPDKCVDCILVSSKHMIEENNKLKTIITDFTAEIINKFTSDKSEELLKQKMEEGYNLFIECKGKGRGYEMTYEGHAKEVNTEFPIETKYYGVGNTIEELLNNMFKK